MGKTGNQMEIKTKKVTSILMECKAVEQPLIKVQNTNWVEIMQLLVAEAIVRYAFLTFLSVLEVGSNWFDIIKGLLAENK